LLSDDFLQVRVRRLGLYPYQACLEAMQKFTGQRDAATMDEIWLLQHLPVFSQGQAGKPEHILSPGVIPIVQSDRGGQVTYHAPGQLVVYLLLDLKRLHLGVRQLVSIMENSIIALLHEYGIQSSIKHAAPGVYVAGRKLASLGLRVRRGCSFHGLALNVDMDMHPFKQINPCGYPDLSMVQLCDLYPDCDIDRVEISLLDQLCHHLGYNKRLESIFVNETLISAPIGAC
jgi:lipoyl(octanoyl) transferase